MNSPSEIAGNFVRVAITGAFAAVSVLALVAGNAKADVSDVTLSVCIPDERAKYCAEADQLSVGTSFGFTIGWTVRANFMPGDVFRGKAPAGSRFSPGNRWFFNEDRQDPDNFRLSGDDPTGATFVAQAVNDQLNPGKRALARFGPGEFASINEPIPNFNVAIGTQGEPMKVTSNSIPVVPRSSDPKDLTTRIRSGPSGRTKARRVTFRFSSEGAAGYVCRIDSRDWDESCDSPKRYRVAKGKHTFRVRAVGSNGRFSRIVKRTFRRV